MAKKEVKGMSKSEISRRKFIITGLSVAAGAALMGCGANSIAASGSDSPANSDSTAKVESTANTDPLIMPWPYETLPYHQNGQLC